MFHSSRLKFQTRRMDRTALGVDVRFGANLDARCYCCVGNHSIKYLTEKNDVSSEAGPMSFFLLGRKRWNTMCYVNNYITLLVDENCETFSFEDFIVSVEFMFGERGWLSGYGTVN